MSKKNRVRHGQFSTDIGATAGTANVPGDENRSTGSAALEPAQPSTDAGDGSADAADLLGAGGIDSGDQAAATDPVSAVGQAGRPAEEQAEEMSDGQSQEAQGNGGEDPAASGNGGADASGTVAEPAAAAGNAAQDPGKDAPGDVLAGGVAGQAEGDGVNLWRKKPVVIEAITFDDLVAHGVSSGAPLTGGMPWSFSYKGHPITHENDNCYLIPTLEGTMRFDRGDMLITGVNGEIYPCKPDIFAKTYEQVLSGERAAQAFAGMLGAILPPPLPDVQPEPVPSAQAWQPYTRVQKAGMTAAASMNEAFWALVGFGPAALDDPRLERLNSNYTLWRPAADFIAANRDAPAEAIPIHLALKRIGGSTQPEPLEKTLWTVFKTVFLLVHDAIVEAERAAVETLPAGAATIWPGDLAMQPQPSAFDAAGFSPRR